MSQFLYQDVFDPQVFKISEFDSDYDVTLDPVSECLESLDLEPLNISIPEFDSIGEFTLETVQEVLDTLDVDDYSIPIPEFVSDYDLTLETTQEVFDTFEFDALYDLISSIVVVTPEPITTIHYMFGKPYSPGKFGIPGDYLFPYAYSATNMTLVADTIYYVPIYVPYNMHIVEFGVWINTIDAAGVARLGIYGSQRGFIKELIYSNILSLGNSGYQSVGADIWLTEGLYFLALICNSNTAQIRVSIIDDSLLGITSPNDSNNYTHYTESGLYADGLPDDSGTLIRQNTDTPRIMVKLG